MISIQDLDREIDQEMKQAHDKWGDYHNTHELYAVLLEECEEFWDSVKRNEPDFQELIQVVAVAKRGIIEFYGLTNDCEEE